MHPLTNMNRLCVAHIVLGIAGVITFVLTGQYMDLVHGHLRHMPDGQRMLYRSAHIYFLWSSLLNLLLGSYGTFSERTTLRCLQGVASLAVMAGPVLLLYSFFLESMAIDLARPQARLAIYLALAGVSLHSICAFVSRARATASRGNP